MTSRGMIGRAAVFVAAAMFATAASAWAASAVTVKLKSQHHSGVSATATLTAKDDATTVKVRVSGASGVAYFPDIRRGTCLFAVQAPEIPLALASNKTPSETVIDVPMSHLTSAPYVVMLHAADGTLSSLSPEAAIACGQIQTGAANSVASTAPVTGIGAMVSAPSNAPLSLALLASAGGLAFAAHRLSARGGSQ